MSRGCDDIGIDLKDSGIGFVSWCGHFDGCSQSGFAILGLHLFYIHLILVFDSNIRKYNSYLLIRESEPDSFVGVVTMMVSAKEELQFFSNLLYKSAPHYRLNEYI
jgi:hypothetical protein